MTDRFDSQNSHISPLFLQKGEQSAKIGIEAPLSPSAFQTKQHMGKLRQTWGALMRVYALPKFVRVPNSENQPGQNCPQKRRPLQVVDDA